jgi:hypothetical protein
LAANLPIRPIFEVPSKAKYAPLEVAMLQGRMAVYANLGLRHLWIP